MTGVPVDNSRPAALDERLIAADHSVCVSFNIASSADNPALDAILKDTHTEWSAAISRSSSAAGLELSTGTPVMAIGGFSGSDPAPTLGQFQDDVAQHKVAYYIVVNNRGH